MILMVIKILTHSRQPIESHIANPYECVPGRISTISEIFNPQELEGEKLKIELLAGSIIKRFNGSENDKIL